MPFPYVKQTWTDGVSACSAARNNVHEDGIALAGATGISASPPGAPVDGMIWRLSMGSGVFWFFQYDSAQATYKWVFMGGPPMFSEVTTNESTSSTTYAALATAGPSNALTRAGIYDVETGFHVNVVSATQRAYMSYDIGATGAVDADAVMGYNVAASDFEASVARMRRKTVASASQTLTAKYRVTGGTGFFQNRWMKVTPVQVI